MAKMKAINPKVMEMRERLKDKPQQMQQEMMRIYREEKVNPLGGCLPILVQIPFFIALYWVLLSSVEMRNAPWIGWITRPVVKGSVLHPAAADDGLDAVPDLAQPDAARPDAGQDDVDHAAGVLGDVLRLPGRPGAVLADEQPAVDRAAVVHQQRLGVASDAREATPWPFATARDRPKMDARSRRDDPIVAIATAPGRGAVGIVRVSGAMRAAVHGPCAVARSSRATRHSAFCAGDGRRSTKAWRCTFRRRIPTPARTCSSCMRMAARWCCNCCSRAAGGRRRRGPRTTSAALRLAEPGEFTERAFLNGKLDLAQAEAVADLIDAGTEAAARSAARSLAGEFSREVNALARGARRAAHAGRSDAGLPRRGDRLPAAAPMPSAGSAIDAASAAVLGAAQRGALLREGIHVVMAGQPNVGKSSLLNALAGAELAIVTPIPGTTRDKVAQTIQIEGCRCTWSTPPACVRWKARSTRSSASASSAAGTRSAAPTRCWCCTTSRASTSARVPAGTAGHRRTVAGTDRARRACWCLTSAMSRHRLRPPGAPSCCQRSPARAWTSCAARCSSWRAGTRHRRAASSRARATCMRCGAPPNTWRRRAHIRSAATPRSN